MSGAVAYNPNDPAQNAFLSALASGETGGSADPYYTGVGGSDLSSLISQGDTISGSGGFPSWTGSGDSHAAGAFQFEPATWSSLANEYNLNFADPTDQNEAAWYLAQSTYAQNNNGASLEQALENNNTTQIASSLSGVWPSTDQSAFTSNLGSDLAAGNYTANNIATGSQSPGVVGSTNSDIVPGSENGAQSGNGWWNLGGLLGGNATNNGATGIPSTGTSSPSSSGNGSSLFIRAMVILVGVVILAIALWALLKDTTIGKTVSRAAEGAVG